MTQHTVLFELGCEELPPKSLKTLRDALKAETEKGLKDAGLNFAAIEAYAAPRRLALKIVDIDAAQADTQKRFDGPAVQAAYDAEGKATKALEGFMRGQGITVEQLPLQPELSIALKLHHVNAVLPLGSQASHEQPHNFAQLNVPKYVHVKYSVDAQSQKLHHVHRAS